MAGRRGLSLSAWLRHAGLEQASVQKQERRLDSEEALRDFFTECDAREQGREPDWLEHKDVIEGSKRSGGAST